MESAVSSPSAVLGSDPEEVGFDVFWGFKNHQFLSTTHYSVDIVGHDSFWPGCVQITAGGSIPE